MIQAGDKIVMLYRAQDAKGVSRLGYADSSDGIHFTRRPEPVFSPEADYEKGGGVEDPRLVRFGDTYYLTYTGYNTKDAQLCLATSRDLIHWERKGVLLPAYKGNWNTGWTKSGAIVPEKIDGKYWMYFLGTTPDKNDQMGLAYSSDLIHWTEATKTPVLPRRPGQFDSRVVEPGPPPILTPTASSSSTTVPTISWFTERQSQFSIARIRRNCSIAATNQSSLPKRSGKRWGRFPTWCSLKEWFSRAIASCSITVAPTNT